MMADKSNHQFNNEFIRELLSPYLDNEVSEEERILVEQAVSASPELTTELEALRQTVANISALPYVPAPRPFTLSEADVLSEKPSLKSFFRLPFWTGGLAAVTAVLLCVVVISFFTIGQESANQLRTTAFIAQTTAEEASTEGNKEADAMERPSAASMAHPTTETSENAAAEGAIAEAEMQSLEGQGANSPLLQRLQLLPAWWVFLSGLTIGMVLLTGFVAWCTRPNQP